MYNFNQFCQDMNCEHRVVRYIPARKCTMCNLLGFSFDILSYPEECPFMVEIKAAKALAKEKDVMWKKLQYPNASDRKLRQPADINVNANDITKRLF